MIILGVSSTTVSLFRIFHCAFVSEYFNLLALRQIHHFREPKLASAAYKKKTPLTSVDPQLADVQRWPVVTSVFVADPQFIYSRRSFRECRFYQAFLRLKAGGLHHFVARLDGPSRYDQA